MGRRPLSFADRNTAIDPKGAKCSTADCCFSLLPNLYRRLSMRPQRRTPTGTIRNLYRFEGGDSARLPAARGAARRPLLFLRPSRPLAGSLTVAGRLRADDARVTVTPMDLTFELVDDLAFAAQRGRAALDGHMVNTNVGQLSPMVEYAWLRRTLPLPSLAVAPATPLSAAFRRFINSRTAPAGSLNDGTKYDFIQTPTTSNAFRSPAWVAFMSRMRFAAEAHGFGTLQAAGLVGAMGEMASNAFEHSQRPDSAVVGFCSEPDAFEFVVADAGIGAAASLRLGREFEHIHDSGEALKLCITDGISRHGSNAHRGHGFQELFARLADFNARVRIRSDDQVIDLRGDRLGPPMAVPAGRPPVSGFLVCTQCFPPT